MEDIYFLSNQSTNRQLLCMVGRSNMAFASTFDNQYKLVSTLFIIGCLDVSDTQLLKSYVKGAIEPGKRLQTFPPIWSMFSWNAPYLKISWSRPTKSTITVLNSYSASHDNWCTTTLWNRIMTAQCEGMGEVGSARYEPALLPPCSSIRVLSYSNYQEIHSRQQTGLAV